MWRDARPVVRCRNAITFALLSFAFGRCENIAVQPEVAAVLVEEDLTVMSNGFDRAECMFWQTYGAKDGNFHMADIKPLDLVLEPDGSSHAVSRSPWWIDPNHSAPGGGYLNLIAVAYFDGYPDFDAEIRSLATGKPLDLRNANLAVTWRAPTLSLAQDSRLVLWFQAHAFDPHSGSIRRVNYALTGQPLEPRAGDAAWESISLKLSTEDDQWTCLGSNPDRTDMYGCASDIEAALAGFDIDLGFVILSQDEGSAMSNTGEVEFDSVMLTLPFGNHKSSVDPLVTLDIERNTCGLDGPAREPGVLHR